MTKSLVLERKKKPFNAVITSQFMREKFMAAMREKKSQLCVGLDPSPETGGPDDLLDFCSDIVEKTSDFCFCYKPNTQYVLPMGFSEIKALNDLIHRRGCLSISDHKLSDIGSTNRAALFWLSSMGFDALTYSPFPGNIRETIDVAQRYGLGIITLTLMSNPEADYFMKGVVQGISGYEFTANQVAASNGLGAVVGATCEVEDIKKIHAILTKQLILAPGVGAQGGGLDIVRIFKERTMVNVSRDIITHENPAERAHDYQALINNVIKEM
ncbi:MAG: orotidine 5'-phosphate decarboxylase [Theionarchaea archaeon]|nr:orotidine 5'-phosphate decarboxylase [Theionarchaea archaeon]